jgi:hypothetical protein
MRATERLASGDEIAFGQLLVYFHGRIWEPAQERAEEFLESARWPGRLRDGATLRPVVVNELRVKYLIGKIQVVLILAPLHELSHGTLVVLA